MLATMNNSEHFRENTTVPPGDLGFAEIEPEEIKAKKSRRRRRNQMKRIPLWYFLYELLCMDHSQQLVQWSGKHPYEFTIKAPQEVAELWGQMKEKSNMTYAKLARGIRYYYGKGVIEKVPRSRFSYRFIPSKKTSCLLGKQGAIGLSPMPRINTLNGNYIFTPRSCFDTGLQQNTDTVGKESIRRAQSPMDDREFSKGISIKGQNFVQLYPPLTNNNKQEQLENDLVDLNSLVDAVTESQLNKFSIKQENEDSNSCLLSEGCTSNSENGTLMQSPDCKPFDDIMNVDDLTTIDKDDLFEGIWFSNEDHDKSMDSRSRINSPEPLESKYFDLHDWISSGRSYVSRDTKREEGIPSVDCSTSSSDAPLLYKSVNFLQRRTRCRTASTESTSTTSSGTWGAGSHDFDVRDRHSANNQRFLRQLCSRLEGQMCDFDSDSDESLYSP